MFIRKGLPFNIDAPFTGDDGTQYPAGWLKGQDAEGLLAFGITEVADPVYKDPKYYANSDGADGEVISVPHPLNQVLARIFQEINAFRDELTHTGGYKVVVDGEDKWFHSDVFSRSQQIGLVLLGQNIPAGTKWKTMDGSFVTMTPALAQQIFQAAALSDMAIFAAAEAHKVTLQAAADVDEIAAYDWNSGWPERFVRQAVV